MIRYFGSRRKEKSIEICDFAFGSTRVFEYKCDLASTQSKIYYFSRILLIKIYNLMSCEKIFSRRRAQFNKDSV